MEFCQSRGPPVRCRHRGWDVLLGEGCVTGAGPSSGAPFRAVWGSTAAVSAVPLRGPCWLLARASGGAGGAACERWKACVFLSGSDRSVGGSSFQTPVGWGVGLRLRTVSALGCAASSVQGPQHFVLLTGLCARALL